MRASKTNLLRSLRYIYKQVFIVVNSPQQLKLFPSTYINTTPHCFSCREENFWTCKIYMKNWSLVHHLHLCAQSRRSFHEWMNYHYNLIAYDNYSKPLHLQPLTLFFKELNERRQLDMFCNWKKTWETAHCCQRSTTNDIRTFYFLTA